MIKTREVGGHYNNNDCGSEPKPHSNNEMRGREEGKKAKIKNAPTRASNLKRHLQRFHPEVLKAVDEKDCIQTNEPVPSSSSQTKEQRTLQPSVARYFVSDKVTVTMTVDTFKKQIIELVVKDSVPISLFSRPAFMCLNGEMARKLGVSLERESIRKLVIEEAFKQKEELKKTLKGRFLFLKMDACTRHRVNYFAINVRLVCDKNEIVTKTLAVKDTKAHHTSEFLQVLVEKVLQDYELKKEQVLSVVTDNASNMISTIKLMNESNDGDQQLELHSGSTDTEMFELEEHSIVTEEQTEVASDEQQHDSLDDRVETVSICSFIHHMRCVVHTLQLAIRDRLQEGHAAALIGKVRKLATVARTPKVDSILKRRAGKGAIIDQATRWEYLMIQRLVELKTFLVDMANPQLTLNESQWNQVTELEKLLEHPFTVTKKLQAEDLTPGIFLKEWKNLMFRLSQRGGLIASGIATSMKRREELLLQNNILLEAVYVDPMHRILLDNQQLSKGKEALFEIAVRMKGLQNSQEEQEEFGRPATSSPSSSTDEEFNFEKYLDHKDRTKRSRIEESSPSKNTASTFQQNFSCALKEIEKFDRSSKITVQQAIPLYPDIWSDYLYDGEKLNKHDVNILQH
ncbi:LOW QUALITY PROTEIN: uncharacterized protein ACNLHF_005976 [Anomaloglossus baeobatrachus]